MSSNYYIFCLNHDPAIVIDHEWVSAAEAVNAVGTRTHDTLRPHQTCDLLIGRYSGALVEVCCPGGDHPGLLHRGEEWAEVGWLRLLHAAHQSEDAAVVKAAQGVRDCWSTVRLARLGAELGVS